MAISYDDFIVQIPYETKMIIDKYLKYLYYYIDNEFSTGLDFYDESSDICEEITLLLYILSEDDKYSVFTKNIGLKKEDLSIEDYDLLGREIANNYSFDFKETFKKYSNLFQFFEEDYYYPKLTPLHVLNNLLTNYKINIEDEDYREDFDEIIDMVEYSNYNVFVEKFNDLVAEINRFNSLEEKIIDSAIQKDIYGNLPISVIEWLELSSSLFLQLKNQCNNYNEAAVLSLFYVINNSDNKDLCKLKYFLKDKHYQSMLNKINNNFEIENDIIGDQLDVYVMDKVLKKFVQSGVCEKKETSDITVNDIFKNLLDRNISKSVIVEQLFSSVGYTKEEILEELNNQVDKPKEYYKQLELNKFYDKLPKETIEFIEFSTKTYQLIDSKKDVYNKNLIITKNDIITLSLYIANYYYKGKISEFYEDNGVNYNKILEYLKLNITKEEIEQVEINQDIIISNYEKFTSNNESSMTIDSICRNLCDVNFCDSLILKNVFNRLSFSYNIGDVFEENVKEHFKIKQNKLNEEIKNQLFYNISNEMIIFLEDLSKIYQFLEDKTNYSLAEIKYLSVLITTLLLGLEQNLVVDTELINFLNHNNIYISSFNSNITMIGNYYNNYQVNYEILKNEYYNLIFGINDKKVANKQIELIDIMNNLFDRNISNANVINRILKNCNVNFDTFENFNEKYKNFKLKLKMDETYGEDKIVMAYLITASIIHGRISRVASKKNLIETDEDIELISLMLTCLLRGNIERKFYDFLNKQNISSQNIIDYFGLMDLDLRLDFPRVENELNYEIFNNYYNKYFSCVDTHKDILKRIICEHTDSMIIKNMVDFYKGNYDILKYEIENEREYQPTLSDKMLLFQKEKVDNLDIDDMDSILKFGNSLSNYSKEIYNEISNLLFNDSDNEIRKKLKSIIDRIYQSDDINKKKCFFKILLKKETNINKKVLNLNEVDNLKLFIDDSITSLSKELLECDTLRKYIITCQSKINNYIEVVKGNIKQLEGNLNEIYLNNDEIRSLNISSNLHLIKEKEKYLITSSSLLKQEFIKLNQVIIDNFMTINILELAKDNLIPLISRDNEELSYNVINLFRAILVRDEEEVNFYMNKLYSNGISSEKLELLSNNIINYINELQQGNSMKVLDCNDDLEKNSDIKTKKLTLNEKIVYNHNFFPTEIY